ncbi:MAG: hypothetical protein ACRYFU_08140 [Janthinobacterium lividum]
MKPYAAVFATLASLTIFSHAAQAQTSPASTTSATIAPPMLPLLTNYHFWPVQFVQWVGTELPYSMIELDVDPGAGKHPLLYVTLTDRVSGKRIHYAENEGLVATAAAMGEEAHKTTIAYEPADTENTGSITTVRFAMADGKPLQWRFVQGSDISEQGSGLSPLPDAKIPIFAYREQAAVAGEGTALQIADTVSTASVWKEISQPPYFVAYRGADSQNTHTLVFLPGKENWTVTSAPAALSSGATWEMDEAKGNHRSIRIDKIDGMHITATATDRFQPGVHCTLEATRTGDGWSLDRVRFAPVRDGEKHALTLQFTTPLSSTADTTNLTLLAGKKPIASGSLASTGGPQDHTWTLTFANPTWLAGKTLVEGGSSVTKEVVTAAQR